MLNKQRLLTPGPTPLPERVRLALARDMVHHRKPEFKQLLHEVQEGLRTLFGTSGPVLSLAASGSGAMTAAVTGLFAAGETVVTIEGGKFGERWTRICAASGVKAIPLSVPWGEGASLDAVERALDAAPEASGLLVQVSETSTGAMHPVRELAALAAKRGVLLVADGVSAVSISPCPMDEWGLDCLLTGSQKGLLLPPGLSFIALSERAWEKAERAAGRDFYFNLVEERANLAKDQTCFTPAINLLYGLHESLGLLLEEGLDAVYRKQWALTCMARAAVSVMGFELLAKKNYTWGLTSVKLPGGIASGPLLARAAEQYGVVMASGMGHMKDSVVRIGHMGWVDFGDLAAGLYALAASFQALGGHLGARDYLEQACVAYERALTDELP
ncbi:MAG: alanine--glyoxylate aminotransferase family protein [Deltaproteobacteria bacterium]|jgi:aspartate aminotransferase-like enzyme|nr:alanine--glyoxylate aminotransferase family protein [Deltaproteobacteria bacterium]